MAQYTSEVGKTTLATAVGAWAVEAPATGMRRVKIVAFTLGYKSAPADVSAEWRCSRSTAAHTGTGKTEEPVDPADAAAVTVVKDALTVQGALGSDLGNWGLYQRGTFEKVFRPGSEWVIPATASAGIIWRTPTINGTAPDGSGTVAFEEQ